jgi:glycosyltransferase involved in cell wall biosynthesis
LEDELDRAVWEGIALSAQDRKPAALSASPSTFLPFPRLRLTARKLTICFTLTAFPPTIRDPHGRHVWNLARGLAEQEHEIHLFAAGNCTERTTFEQGVWVHLLTDDPVPGVAIHRALTCLAQTRSVDVVVVHDCEGIYCLHDPAFNCVLTLGPTRKMQREDFAGWQRTPGLEHTLYLEQLLLESARQVIAHSAGLLHRVRQHHGVPAAPAQVHVCPPAIRDRARNFSPCASSAHRVLFVGSLGREHGADLFLQAATTLIREGRDVEAILTGDPDAPSEAGPSWRALVERQAAKLPELRRRVVFLGELSEDGLYQALGNCDVVCLPYRVDAATVPCLEAMMFGRSIVASDLDSARELLADGAVGRLIQSKDADAFADSLRELLSTEGLCRRLGDQARQAYETRFAFERVLETTLAAYEQSVERAAMIIEERPR